MVHIFLLRGDSSQRSKIVDLFQQRRFTIYDHEYPSKLAAPVALRQNVPGMPKARLEELALVSRRICDILLTTKGPQQVANDFLVWLRQQKTDRVLIVGVSNAPMWDGATEYLKRQLKVVEVNDRMSDHTIMNLIDRQVIRYEK